jgi:hypothetical protein
MSQFESIDDLLDYLGYHYLSQELVDEARRLIDLKVREHVETDRDIWRSVQNRVLTD